MQLLSIKRYEIIILISFLLLCGINGFAQSYRTSALPNGSAIGINQRHIVKLHVPLLTTTHFVSPEPIDYVDISTPAVQGDLTADNLFRIRPVTDVIKDGDQFTITVVTKSFIVAYEITADENVEVADAVHIIKVNPNDGMMLNQSDVLSQQQCFDLSVMAFKRKRSVHHVHAHSGGMHLWLNGVYVFGDYILLDIQTKIKSQIPYTIDNMRFKIMDKKQLSATVSQDIEMEPYYHLYPYQNTTINKEWRNFFVFRKFTYPSAKILNIELTENQYSGRKIELNIDYKQILQAINLL